MKIIFSRKGFDGENGGVPSPIFPDGTMFSLPIPRKSPVTYGQIACPKPQFRHLGEVVEHLTRYRMSDSCCAHLDPDLDYRSIKREQGWRGIFGQSEKAERELENGDVQAGDLFLFFGQFCRVDTNLGGEVQYKRRAQVQQIIFGWLRIAERYQLPKEADQVPLWAKYHPHLNYARIEPVPNVVYVAAERLDSEIDAPGWGVFEVFHNDLCLTHPIPVSDASGKQKVLPSRWRLPAWMHPWRDPAGVRPPLTRHREERCWSGSDHQFATLQTVSRGQEFILDADYYPEAWPWAKELITNYWLAKR